MFLSKKNAIYYNKPKIIDPTKQKRILPGWQSQQQNKQQQFDYKPKQQKKPQQNINLLMGQQIVDLTSQIKQTKDNSNKFYLNWDELDIKQDLKIQKQLIQEIVKPGGIRVKPNDGMLNQFLKEIKGMEIHYIGSLLLSKIQVNYPFQTKAKALYVIQFLIKKNQQYLSFFKAHIQKLKEFPQPQDNVDNYRKILKSVLNLIGVSTPLSQPDIAKKVVYVDPGYNNDSISQMSNFIQQNTNKVKKSQPKKAIIGPGQKIKKQSQNIQMNKNQNDDFLNLDLLGNNKQLNLLNQQVSQARPNNQNLLI